MPVLEEGHAQHLLGGEPWSALGVTDVRCHTDCVEPVPRSRGSYPVILEMASNLLGQSVIGPEAGEWELNFSFLHKSFGFLDLSPIGCQMTLTKPGLENGS